MSRPDGRLSTRNRGETYICDCDRGARSARSRFSEHCSSPSRRRALYRRRWAARTAPARPRQRRLRASTSCVSPRRRSSPMTAASTATRRRTPSKGEQDQSEPSRRGQVRRVPRLPARRRPRRSRRFEKLYDYRYSFNGFAAKLIGEQARRPKGDAGRASRSRRTRSPRSRRRTTPTFLGLDAPGGSVEPARRRRQVAARTSSSASSTPASGPSTRASATASASTGTAQGREARLPADSRLARQVHPGRGLHRLGLQPEADRRAATTTPASAASRTSPQFRRLPSRRATTTATARHTASHGAAATTASRRPATAAPFGKISGMAPAARVAMYKACWGDSGTIPRQRASTSIRVAAIDQAVADGVDVINYSISGTTTANFLDPARDSVPLRGRCGCVRGSFCRQRPTGANPQVPTIPAPGSPQLRRGPTTARAFEATLTLGNGGDLCGASLQLTEHDCRFCRFWSLSGAIPTEKRRPGNCGSMLPLADSIEPGPGGREDGCL